MKIITAFLLFLAPGVAGALRGLAEQALAS